MLNASLIEKEKEIESFVKEISNSNNISIDIEFMRRSTFYPEPCVIQISNGHKHGCIDLTLGIHYKNLFQSIFNENKKIILHSCRQDLEILHMILGYIPKNIFDTQFAASFLGFKYQIGYAELIKEIYDIDIDKTEKMTDWKKRPLSKEQIKYAINDVVHLNKLSEHLTKKLNETKKIEYFEEEFSNYLNDIDWEPSANEAWKKIKAINNLNNETKDIAKVLSVWREKKAMKKDIPRNWILTEKEIIEISKEYSKNRRIPLSNKNLYLEEIQSEINKYISSGKKITTEKKELKYNSNYKKITHDLYEYYKNISIENKISYQILSPKKMVISYLKTKDNDSRLVTGWRKKIIDIDKITKITNPLFNPD